MNTVPTSSTIAPDLAGEKARVGFQTAERLVRRLVLLFSNPPGEPERHPAWSPELRQAVERATRAIGRGDTTAMEEVLAEIDRLTSR